MNSQRHFLIPALLLLALLLQGCGDGKPTEPVGSDGWLRGDVQEKFHTVADQLRGFDMAMVETGYRYQELYWAGQDENWEYAAYQAEKIRVAIEGGLQRRPARAPSAQQFLNVDLPDVQEAIQRSDPQLFHQQFRKLRNSCNACHAMENVARFYVRTPNVRHSIIGREP